MIQLTAMLVHEDLADIDAALRLFSECMLIPFWSTSEEFLAYEELPTTPRTTKFAWWFPKDSPPFRMLQIEPGKFCLAGSEFIVCARANEINALGDCVMFNIPEHVEVEPNRFEPISSTFRRHVLELQSALRILCFTGKDRMLYSKRLAAQLVESPDPPEWALRYQRRIAKETVASRESVKRDYESSFVFLREQIGLEGNPHRRVRRRPQFDEAPVGPSIFRATVANRRFERITLPGLYIGRSELANTSFSSSKLYGSTFNWSEFSSVDFSNCDLHDSDLRACSFETCNFAGADLRDCDLRGSAFSNCDFAGARLDGAMALDDQEKALPLAAEQRASVTWTEAYEEPAGG